MVIIIIKKNNEKKDERLKSINKDKTTGYANPHKIPLFLPTPEKIMYINKRVIKERVITIDTL